MPVPLGLRPAFLPALSGFGLAAYDGSMSGLRKATPARAGSAFFNFARPIRSPKPFLVSGVSRDSTGAVLGSCVVDLFRIFDPTGASEPPAQWLARTVSDATTGAYSFTVASEGWLLQAVFYKAGAPDLAGVTKNTIVGA